MNGYRIKVVSNKSGEATWVARLPQYVQCERGNHLTSKTKRVESWSLKADADRELSKIVAGDLMMHNAEVEKAHRGYARVKYTFSNGDDLVVYTVEPVALGNNPL